MATIIKNTVTAIATFCAIFPAAAQLCNYEVPVGYCLEANRTRETIQTIVMPELDMKKIEEEDKLDEMNNLPLRFGYSHKVKLDLTNSGTWHLLSNGDKLWRLNIVCPKAKSVSFNFDKFWLPEGGKFFVYSSDKKQSLGAFTSRNVVGDSINANEFATGILYGEDMTLEYYQPKEVTSKAVISIDYVIHGYKGTLFRMATFGSSGSCMVNVNCEEGQNWQNEKKAIAFVVLQGRVLCSGALLTTTDMSQEPFFLTANHCINGLGDATGSSTLNNSTLFYWNYEMPGCINDSIQPIYYHTRGATIVANNSSSDFALLRLIEDPKDLPNYTPYYLGWDWSGNAGDPGVCIHHPKGDVKKISTIDESPVPAYYTPGVAGGSHWKVYWKETLNGYGTVEKGSSGAPLLTSDHRVIGQLHKSATEGCNSPYLFSRFGKFSVSWTGNNNDSICRRIDHWLDPQSTGA